MSDIVNLNRFRKSKDRMNKRSQADENVAKFGRTKIERELDIAREKKAREALKQHKLDEE